VARSMNETSRGGDDSHESALFRRPVDSWVPAVGKNANPVPAGPPKDPFRGATIRGRVVWEDGKKISKRKALSFQAPTRKTNAEGWFQRDSTIGRVRITKKTRWLRRARFSRKMGRWCCVLRGQKKGQRPAGGAGGRKSRNLLGCFKAFQRPFGVRTTRASQGIENKIRTGKKKKRPAN